MENTSEGAPATFGLISLTNASLPPALALCVAFDVVGKLVDDVWPVMKTFGGLDESSARAKAVSRPLPPKYVEYKKDVPPGFKTVKKALPDVFAARCA